MSYIEINEEWVKDRVKITKEKLDDIKSLLLPGTFDEKILNLGSSLFHFTRLKELDLSRNVIENLDGLGHLLCLENLNLYYNNVASLKELYKLRNNQKLTQLDLRLNPVARNEADYRLCLIHMLPFLIRLDDRCVKDEERKAALMYFGSDQSREFSPNKPDEPLSINNISIAKSHRKTHPRVDMVNRWTKGVLTEHYLEKDGYNEAFHLNLGDINVTDDGINAPRDKDSRSVKEYTPRVYSKKRLDVEREFSLSKHGDRVNNFSTVPVFVRTDDKKFSNKVSNKESHSAFSLYKTQLIDRAHGDGYEINTLDQEKPGSIRNGFEKSLDSPKSSNAEANGHIGYQIPREITNRICDLVDRYWNGSRSLHENPKFITCVSNIVFSYYSELKSDSVKNENPMETIKGNHNSCGDNDELREIKSANETLKDQIKELRHKLLVSEKFSEITELLKQSHETLITTNEQLRKQLDNQDKRNSIKNDKK